MSDADQVQLSYAKEANFAVDPGSGYQAIRFTGEALGLDTSTSRSGEITNDRQTSDIVRTNISVAGNVDIEMSAVTFDDMLVSSLMASTTEETDFLAGTTTDESSLGNITFTSPGSLTDRDAGGAWGTDMLYQWIKIAGATDSTNNGYFKVVTRTDGDNVTVEPAILTTNSTDTGITITRYPSITNGTTLRTYSWQRNYTDLGTGTDTYAVILGTAPDQWNLSIANEAIITGGFTFVGASEASGTGTAATPAAATTTQVMNSVDHVAYVQENSASFGITGLTLALANNLRARLQVATLGAISLGKGQVAVSGTLQSYFSSVTHFDRYLNFGVTNLASRLVDDAGKGYVLDIPSVRLSAGKRVAGSQNSDVINDMSWEAFKDATEGKTIRIAKIVP